MPASARPCPDRPPVPPSSRPRRTSARPADRGRALPAARGRAARHRRPLRGEGEPRAGPARRPARGGQPVRRGQPGRGARGARGRRARRATSSTPTRSSAATTSRSPPRAASACSWSTPARRPPRSRTSPPARAVLCRLVTSGEGSDWPLSRKYGCSTGQAVRRAAVRRAPRPGPGRRLLPRRLPAARPGGLGAPRSPRPRGSSRPCGRRPRPWLLDLGGGFPASLEAAACRREVYGDAIERLLDQHFGDRPAATTLIEPGRGIVADAGVLRRRGARRRDAAATPGGSSSTSASSPAWSRRSTRRSATRSRPTATAARPAPAWSPGRPATAPTCSTSGPWWTLPLDLAEGDTVRLLGAGAYTSCYSTVGFNGFPPLSTHAGPDEPPASRSGASSRRTPRPSVAMSLPWPLLLVLAWDQYGDGRTARS